MARGAHSTPAQGHANAPLAQHSHTVLALPHARALPHTHAGRCTAPRPLPPPRHQRNPKLTCMCSSWRSCAPRLALQPPAAPSMQQALDEDRSGAGTCTHHRHASSAANARTQPSPAHMAWRCRKHARHDTQPASATEDHTQMTCPWRLLSGAEQARMPPLSPPLAPAQHTRIGAVVARHEKQRQEAPCTSWCFVTPAACCCHGSDHRLSNASHSLAGWSAHTHACGPARAHTRVTNRSPDGIVLRDSTHARTHMQPNHKRRAALTRHNTSTHTGTAHHHHD